MIAPLLLLACAGQTPAEGTAGADPVPTVQQEPRAPEDHPGQIVFVDLDAGTEQTRPVSEVPESVAWVVLGDRRVPVVRVESRKRGPGREIVKMGPDGQELERTMGR